MRLRTHLGSQHASDDTGIDLAPMLDFVVNLLIFFIITAVFVKQAGLEVNRPSRTPDMTNKPSKTFVINEAGDISIDAKTIDFRAVRAHVEQFKAVDSQGGIVVVADRRAPMGVVVSVTDQIRLAGVSDITFTTTTLAKKQP
jgi:biopolymer transport protein ExbD